MSFGLIRSEEPMKIREQHGAIAGYDVYKSLFGASDNFNRGLHDKRWPHRIGGGKSTGKFACAHDFMFACIFQNTFNFHAEMGGAIERKMSFQDKCIVLSD